MKNLQKRLLPPLAGIVFLLAVWQLMCEWANVPSYLLPHPLAVWKALVGALLDGYIFVHLMATLGRTLAGYAIACGSALIIALAVTEFKLAERLITPLYAALQSIPKIALAPLLFIWVGFGDPSIITLAALASYWPVLINAISGLRSYDRDLEVLYRACGAGRFKLLLDVKLPGAASQIFAGLEIALVFALIGDVVMEFLVASRGLGFVIVSSARSADLPLNFAAIFILAALGIVLSAMLRAARRRVIFWERVGVASGSDS